LALLQAHGSLAVGAGELHTGQHVGMALKKFGRVEQKLGNIVFGNGLHGWGLFHGYSLFF
jgi:hypothetical protein